MTTFVNLICSSICVLCFVFVLMWLVRWQMSSATCLRSRNSSSMGYEICHRWEEANGTSWSLGVFNTCTKSHHRIKQMIKCNKRMCSSARSQAVAGLLWSHIWHLHSTLEVPTATPSSARQVKTCYKKIYYKRTKEDAYCKSSLWSGNGMSAMNKNIIDRWKCQNHCFLKLPQKISEKR